MSISLYNKVNPKIFINTIYAYKDSIVNSLDTSYTNAVVEVNNNIIKSFKKTAFGFRNFRNLRLRILLGKNIKIVKLNSIKDIKIGSIIYNVDDKIVLSTNWILVDK